MPGLFSLAERSFAVEQMDDLSIRDARIENALYEIRYVNRYLGGYRALKKALRPVLDTWNGKRLTVLDLGAGLADYAVELVRWGRRRGVAVDVTAVDANPEAVRCAQAYLDRRLSPALRRSVRALVADALHPPFSAGTFHITTASLFLHHFRDDEAVRLLRVMDRTASLGIVVNDLHRHPLALAGIRSIAAVLPVSPMFRHDGPLSVRRAFRPEELQSLAGQAGLRNVAVRRHWAFRVTLSTLPDGRIDTSP
ncbi:MAG: methyltransferase domain-containing protein [Rhodothermales bacterium]